METKQAEDVTGSILEDGQQRICMCFLALYIATLYIA